MGSITYAGLVGLIGGALAGLTVALWYHGGWGRRLVRVLAVLLFGGGSVVYLGFMAWENPKDLLIAPLAVAFPLLIVWKVLTPAKPPPPTGEPQEDQP